MSESSNPVTDDQPDEQEVFALLYEMSGALLKWSEEGITGMEAMVLGVGEAYVTKHVTALFSPQSVLLVMGRQVELFREKLPGLPALNQVTALRHWHDDVPAGKLNVQAARERLQLKPWN